MFIDHNRYKAIATDGRPTGSADPCKSKIYDFFHNAISQAAKEIHDVFGKGIGFDIHGMKASGTGGGNIQIGFGVNNFNLPASKLKQMHAEKFFGDELVNDVKRAFEERGLPTQDLNTMIRGPWGLGTFLSQGYDNMTSDIYNPSLSFSSPHDSTTVQPYSSCLNCGKNPFLSVPGPSMQKVTGHFTNGDRIPFFNGGTISSSHTGSQPGHEGMVYFQLEMSHMLRGRPETPSKVMKLRATRFRDAAALWLEAYLGFDAELHRETSRAILQERLDTGYAKVVIVLSSRPRCPYRRRLIPRRGHGILYNQVSANPAKISRP